jgi:hypothetical protein
VSRGKKLRRVKRSAMDLRSSSSLRRKNSKKKYLLGFEISGK